MLTRNSLIFFFSSRRRHTRSLRDWNSDVCSSDLFVDTKGRPIRKYFQSRPSAALGAEGKTTEGYDPTLSSGSNLGPTNPTLIKEVAQRAEDYRRRSEERRVGKECRSRWTREPYKE